MERSCICKHLGAQHQCRPPCLHVLPRNTLLDQAFQLPDGASADNQGELDIIITPARREPHTWASSNMNVPALLLAFYEAYCKPL